MKKQQDLEIKFWRKWLKANSLKRFDLVESLPVINSFMNIKNIKDKKIMKQIIAGILNSYFEDLESTIYSKNKDKRK